MLFGWSSQDQLDWLRSKLATATIAMQTQVSVNLEEEARKAVDDPPCPLIDDAVALPPDGGWGWVVCMAGFFCNLVLDGIAYSFGILLTPLVMHFTSDESTVAWVGSLLCGMYMMSGPLVGGLVNRWGAGGRVFPLAFLVFAR